MHPLLTIRELAAIASVAPPEYIMSIGRWTKDQLKLAFHLYCQLPFGKLHLKREFSSYSENFRQGVIAAFEAQIHQGKPVIPLGKS